MAFKIDRVNNCIDRNTEEGRMLDKLQAEADAKGGNIGKFINAVAAFTEVGTVVDKTMSKEDSEKMMGRLRDEFAAEIAKAKHDASAHA